MPTTEGPLKWSDVNPGRAVACPLCDHPYIHFDRVDIAAGAEDEELKPIRVNAVTGTVHTGDAVFPVPIKGRHVGEGRRHRVALLGWCEGCGHPDGRRLALVFTQHKGETLVEVVEVTW
jgi:hypothetical protein